MNQARVQTTKTPARKSSTTDSKANYDTETNTLDVEKIKHHRNQNFEDEANNMQLAELGKEDTRRSNLNRTGSNPYFT